MRFRAAVTVLLVAAGLLLWRSELFTVQKPGAHPQPLRIVAPIPHETVPFDASLPAASGGVERLTSDGRVLVLHYWAPWQLHSAPQAAGIDSLRRLPGFERMRAVVVCFDPFPSVARYVRRHRLRVPVLLDTGGHLRAQLPCPSIPFTYVLDGEGRILIRQAGDVDWLAPESIATLRRLIERNGPPDITWHPGAAPAPPTSRSS